MSFLMSELFYVASKFFSAFFKGDLFKTHTKDSIRSIQKHFCEMFYKYLISVSEISLDLESMYTISVVNKHTQTEFDKSNMRF